MISIFKVYITWLIGIVLIAYFGVNMLLSNEFELVFVGKSMNPVFSKFDNWDGGHFLSIAEQGYTNNNQYAFFPAFPLFIKTLSTVLTLKSIHSALVINLVASLGCMLVFYTLLKLDYSNLFAQKILAIFLSFPTSFYLVMVYSESLFLLLTLASFYFMRREKWFLAILFSSIASATRLVGIATVIALWVEYFFVKKTKSNNYINIIILFAPLGLLLYCYFLYTKTGNPLYFLVSEENWLRSIILPGLSIWESLNQIFITGLIIPSNYFIIDLMFSVLGIGLVLRAFRFLRPSYCIYGLVSVLLPLVTPTLISMPRFLLLIFPIFIMLGKIPEKYIIYYQLISFLFLITFVALFVNGAWVS